MKFNKSLIAAAMVAATLACSTSFAQNNALGALGGLLQGLGKTGQTPTVTNNNLVPGGSNAGQIANMVQMASQAVQDIDEPSEIEIGRQLAAVLLGAKPLYPDMALQRYVNQLGRWISLQSPRPNLPWTFAVLDDNGFNAFAAPGGYVFVTKGLVDKAGGEAELAGILAHEMTHVTSKHHLKAIQKSAATGLLTQVAASQLKNNLGGAISAQMLQLGRDLYSRGLDQDDEFEADRVGVALAARAGFDPYGLVGVLQELRTAVPSDPIFALTLSTHPAAQTRLDQLEGAMGNRLDGFTGQPSITVAQRLTQAAQIQAAAMAPVAQPIAPAKSAPARNTRQPVKK